MYAITQTSCVTKNVQAGGMAGTSVDMVLFPLDTMKTRLQSPQGFRAAGGFRGMYSGLLSAALGSAPTGEVMLCCLIVIGTFKIKHPFQIL